MKPYRSVPLEYPFVVAVLASGLVLFVLGTTLIANTQYEQYISSRIAVLREHTREVLHADFTDNDVDGQTKVDDKQRSATYQKKNVVDTLALKKASRRVVRYRAPYPRPHPFLGNNVLNNPDVCRNSSVDVLIVIHSAVHNFQRRRILRETWAATNLLPGISVRRVFALGRARMGGPSQVLVDTEQATYGDIVQGDFSDTHFNLTRKAVTMLRWINNHCAHARFVVKTDDDVFVNMFVLVETYLERLADQRRAVMCQVNADNTFLVERDPRSRWYVSSNVVSLLGRNHWPPFCSGYLVAMTTDVVALLYKTSFTVPYMPLDDRYVYGVLPLSAGRSFFHYIDVSSNLTETEGQLLSHYTSTRGAVRYVGGTVGDETTMMKLWLTVMSKRRR